MVTQGAGCGPFSKRLWHFCDEGETLARTLETIMLEETELFGFSRFIVQVCLV